ncbi:MAG TPA: sigma 54-interacting transcriptional regulator [Nannocystaceae bacterium]|nr:sigma 54-interacting transcriptional regulator [Nannocystaceae bacterium]
MVSRYDVTRQTDRPPPEGRGHLLVLGDGEVSRVPLPDAGEVRIGRGDDVDLRIDHDSVSRKHAVLRVGATIELEDLGSSNGTRLGGVPLVARAPKTVVAGDVIELGDITVLVQGPPVPTAPGVRVPGGPSSTSLADLVPRIAKSGINVLVVGETGAGKEVMARRIHGSSQRASGPFVAINCGAMPEALLESELFGHEAGAFTGAVAAKPGILETAHKGTVFLDEVGELPAVAQVKLLRVLEDRRVQRVGGTAPREIDVRFLAATHRDLRADVASGRFREDLYYRLSGITLQIPPLRDRLGELPKLVDEFAAKAAADAGRDTPRVSAAALARLREHPWPGNIRELRNVIERAVVLCDTPTLEPEQLVFEAVVSTQSDGEEPDERARILAALTACAGNQTRAAEQLGISRKTLGLKMDALGIARPQKSRPG